MYSCDKDYNSIGDNLIGGSHFVFDDYTSDVVAYNQEITAIQSNNQAVNPLGIYQDPDFGTTTANFVTQLTLAAPNPTLGTNPVVESVELSIPYFVDATQTTVNTAGGNNYVLDSIYGDANAKMKLSVYRSGYYLRNIDPIGGFVEPQKYYTDQNNVFNQVKIGDRLNNNTIDRNENDEFFFSNAQHSVTTTTDGVSTTTYSVPGMKLSLDVDYFQTYIINAVALGKLASNDVFKDYFRGLYFQVEKISSTSSLAMLNFAGGTITIKYKEGEDGARVDNSMVLNLTGNTVSLLEQSNLNPTYTNAIQSSDSKIANGDSRLYVKGGQGAMTRLRLFDKGDLATIKGNGWLVNEANLVFYVDDESSTSSHRPQRLYLYDFTNHRPITDYYDGVSGTTIKNGKTIYGGILTKDASGNSYYKFRLTNHIRNLIQKDSTNIELGLVVTENINTITNAKLKTPTTTITRAPQASVMNPLGIILFGNNIPLGDPNYDKRLRLQIYYTKPN
ncbi:hypothetical protein FUMI01_04630 [Flavobacterium sp. UMI-01]|nr:hypothetical protein FUMI01_04630 [Flavobacterium sp. UMI-01]